MQIIRTIARGGDKRFRHQPDYPESGYSGHPKLGFIASSGGISDE